MFNFMIIASRSFLHYTSFLMLKYENCLYIHDGIEYVESFKTDSESEVDVLSSIYSRLFASVPFVYVVYFSFPFNH